MIEVKIRGDLTFFMTCYHSYPYVFGGDVTTEKFKNNKGLIKGQKELGDYFKKL